MTSAMSDPTGTVTSSDTGADRPANSNAPFVGLEAFDEAKSIYFFGRKTDAMRLASNFLASPLTVMIGESGVGKTSLLRAGVATALKRLEPVEYLVLRDWQSDPFGAVCRALTKRLSEIGSDAENPQSHPAGSPEELKALADAITREHQLALVIVCDQFEEFFLCRNQKSVTAFLKALTLIVRDREADVHIALSMRDDAVYNLEKMQVYLPDVMSNIIRIEALDKESAREAITEPIKRYNELHGTQYKVTREFEDTILESLTARDTTSGRGRNSNMPEDGGRIEAPYLQLAMLKLWQAVVNKNGTGEFNRILLEQNNFDNIVEQHFLEAISRWQRRRGELYAVLPHMITRDGAKIALPIEQLNALVQERRKPGSRRLERRAEADVTPMMQDLSSGARRIFRVNDNGYYELFHDVLAQPANKWIMELREQEKSSKRQRVMLYSTGLLSIFVIIASALWNQHNLFLAFRQEVPGLISEKARDLYASGQISKGNALAMGLIAEQTEGLNSRPGINLNLIGSLLFRQLPAGQAWKDFSYDPQKRCEKTSTGEQAIIDTLDKANTTGTRLAHSGTIYGVDFNHDATRIVSGDRNGIIRVWDRDSGQCLCELNDHYFDNRPDTRGPSIRGVAFNKAPELTHIAASASWDHTARVWDTRACKMLQILDADGSGSSHPAPVRGVAFSQDGMWMGTASYDDTGRIWRRDPSEDALSYSLSASLASDPARGIVGHRSDVLGIAFHPTDPSIVATASYDWTARVWKLSADGAQTNVEHSIMLAGHRGAVLSVGFDPSGNVVTAGEDEVVRFWDPSALRSARATVPGEAVPSLCSLECSAQIHPPKVPMVRGPVFAHNADIWSAKIANAASWLGVGRQVLATGSWDRTAKIFDARDFRPLGIFEGHGERIRDIAISVNARMLATVSRGGELFLWDVEKSNGIDRRLAINSLEPSSGPNNVSLVRATENKVAISPDGLVATGDDHGKVRIFRRGNTCPVVSVAGFNFKGQRPASEIVRRSTCDEPVLLIDHKKACSPGNVTSLEFSDRGGHVIAGYLFGDVASIDTSTGMAKWVSVHRNDKCSQSKTRETLMGNRRVQGLAILGANDVVVGYKDGISRQDLRNGAPKPFCLATGNGPIRLKSGRASHNPANDTDGTCGDGETAVEVAYARIDRLPRTGGAAVYIREQQSGADNPDQTKRRLLIVNDKFELLNEIPLTDVFVSEDPELLAASPDGRFVALSRARRVQVWQHTKSGYAQLPANPPDLHSTAPEALEFLNDEGVLATGSEDEIVRTWDVFSWKQLEEFNFQHEETINELRVSQGDNLLYSGGLDQLVLARKTMPPAAKVLEGACRSFAQDDFNMNEIDMALSNIRRADAPRYNIWYLLGRASVGLEPERFKFSNVCGSRQ